jgi:hypothetical protein
MTTVAGKTEGSGWIKLNPIGGLTLPKMRFIVLCGEDAYPFKFRAVCIDLETDAVGNTIRDVLRGLVEDTSHHIKIALEDFNNDREKTMDALATEMRDKSESRKTAEEAYLEVMLGYLKAINRQAEIRRMVARKHEMEKRVRLQNKYREHRNVFVALWAFLLGYDKVLYKYREAMA